MPGSWLHSKPHVSCVCCLLQGVSRLTRLLLSRAQPKRIGLAPLSGVMLAGLADAYVAAINEGAVPTIATAWQVGLDMCILLLVRFRMLWWGRWAYPAAAAQGAVLAVLTLSDRQMSYVVVSGIHC
eukprot:GHRR01037002.1.p1 GENE.GHRR01037002.1~~GHRR01037002.1.p1  ORF type:complete len:126 (+),score=23.13 GHRR01037002.1:216-593(+)